MRGYKEMSVISISQYPITQPKKKILPERENIRAIKIHVYANVQKGMATNAAKAATTTMKPEFTVIPTTAALVPVGVVLIAELVVDAAGEVGVIITAVLRTEWSKKIR